MNATRHRDYSEKRNFIRMKVDPRAQVSVEAGDVMCEGICHDLSGSGMLLTLPQQLSPDTELLVTLSSAHGHNPMLYARCSVARVEPGPNESWLIGVEIQEILNQPELEEVG